MTEIDLDDEKVLKYFNKWKRPPFYRIQKEYKDYLLNRFDDLSSLDELLKVKESYYRLMHTNENFYCPICGKSKKFKYQSLSYYKTCGDKECNYKYKIITFKDHYNGLVNVFQLEETKEKCKKTWLKKYGVVNPYNIKEIKEKCVKNAHTKEALEKQRKTTYEKYGVICNLLSESAKEKSKETNLNKYNSEYYQSTDKFKKIVSDKLKNKTEEERNEITRKYKETCLKLYGAESPASLKYFHDKIDWNKLIKKQYETKKKNGTLGGPHSKMEEHSYDLIKEKYSDVIRQYISDEYPFPCDFYIPSLNIYIECQYYPAHGKHPYDSNNINDVKYAEYLKNTRFGSYVWTIRDVKKRNIAKENNLNYLEFFTILELKTWLKEYNGK
jgi:hypothetical protein